MTYAVVLTRVRDAEYRDERTMPEQVICRCEFGDRRTAEWTARDWAATAPVRAGRERVKVLVVQSPAGNLTLSSGHG